MKKRVLGFLLVMAILVMTGCGAASTFTVNGSADASKLTVSSKNAGDDIAGGYIKISEGQVLSVDAKVEKGKYEIIILKNDGNTEEYTELDNIKESDIVLTLEIESDGTQTTDIPAGDYEVAVKTTKKTTGEFVMKSVTN